MNRSDLINRLKEDADLGKRDAEVIINTFFNTISDILAEGDRVEIRGFGSFTVKDYKPYVGRNPKSGEKIRVSSKRLPFFKVGKELKEMVDYKD
ncbi:MAG: integration host factor subunit beta [Deltaproteobacteria bacterium]|nr:integration host factor subunit beta [Deltaproteobacteria bacterium]MBW1954475.1 integration host factor subunit beta [Deltaproteobacteria bacterium]MBW2042134.1 integration host factor subunit beta [Deltaproteobacteria bacterium]MBW2132013.1 integration host factor subunit beta [Deltaproteobacteria bacterium]